MIYGNTFFAYPDDHYAQVVALGLPFHDQCCGGVVFALASDETKEEPVKTLGRSGDQDKDHRFVLPVPGIVAVCRVAGADVDRWMVRQGWALAYPRCSRAYVGEEKAARAARHGIWNGRFVPLRRWRGGDRLAGQACRICLWRSASATAGSRATSAAKERGSITYPVGSTTSVRGLIPRGVSAGSAPRRRRGRRGGGGRGGEGS